MSLTMVLVRQAVREAEVDGRRRPGAAVLGIALTLAAIGLSLLRQQGKHSWQSFVGEDGSLLFQDQMDGTTVHHLFESYAGYLVLTPRLLSLPGKLVPVAQAPAYFAVIGAVVVGLVAAAVYRWSDGWVTSKPVRLALAAMVVLAPAAGAEITASMTNTIWVFAMVVPWALLSRHRGGLDVLGRSVVVVLAATGTPLSGVFAPLAAVWAWRRRDRATIIVASAFALGLAAQGAVILSLDSGATVLPVQRPLTDVVNLVGIRVYGVFLVGPGRAVDLWRGHGMAVGLVAAGLVVALYVAAALGAGRRARLLGAMFFGYAALAFLTSIWYRGTLPFRLSGSLDPAAYMRYSAPATFLLASMFAVTVAPVDRPGDAATRTAPAVGRWLFVAHTVVVIALCFPIEGIRGQGPTWRESLGEKAVACVDAPAGTVILVPADADGFLLRVPCDELDGG